VDSSKARARTTIDRKRPQWVPASIGCKRSRQPLALGRIVSASQQLRPLYWRTTDVPNVLMPCLYLTQTGPRLRALFEVQHPFWDLQTLGADGLLRNGDGQHTSTLSSAELWPKDIFKPLPATTGKLLEQHGP